MSEVAELARSLVAIDSVNPELVPGGAGEAEIAAAVAAWLERAGLDVDRRGGRAGTAERRRRRARDAAAGGRCS